MQQDFDDDISHLEWETVRVRFVKAATIEKLVEALSTDDGELDSSTFVNVFLATYRTFATTEQVISLLIDRYERLHLEPLEPNAQSEHHKKSLISALHVWIDGYPEDWNYHNLSTINVFISRRLYSSEIFHKVQSRLEEINRVKCAAAQLHDNYSYLNMPIKRFVEHPSRIDAPSKQFSIMTLTSRRNHSSDHRYKELARHEEMERFNVPMSQRYDFVDFTGGYGTSSMYKYRLNVSVKHFAEQLTRIDAVSLTY